MGTSTYYMKYTHTYVGLPFGNNTRIPLRVRYSHETVRVIARLHSRLELHGYEDCLKYTDNIPV